MITYVKGNLFQSPAKVLVNTVNTVGVMGKGIALEFKRIYPDMFREYQGLCERGQLRIGTLHLFKTPHKWVLNFPTKQHWRQPSRLEYVEQGLQTFSRLCIENGIASAAFPPLGCGNGQLDYETQVRPLMEKYLDPLSIPIFVYPEKPARGTAEHLDIKGIAAWLRSEPSSLPFDEVWTDICELIEQRGEFETPTKRHRYAAHAHETPPTLEVASSGKSYKFSEDDLLEFWQQLRDHGFIYRSITPEHHRISYLIPIFEELEYVRRVVVSESVEGLRKNSAIGLQVVPPPRSERSAQGDLFTFNASDAEAGRT
jgi:O-acetyl-ADP-ribose deacetylase (regulator of RNase III)